MTDTPSARFADYATSGAFAIGLTRGQIATLALIACGDHNPAPHMATIGALERKGLARVIDGDGRKLQAQVRPTAAGALVAQLCAMAGLTNSDPPDLAAQMDRLTDDMATAREEIATMAEDCWSMHARMQAAEWERDALAAEKAGGAWPKPLVTLKDRQPGKPVEAMAFAAYTDTCGHKAPDHNGGCADG